VSGRTGATPQFEESGLQPFPKGSRGPTAAKAKLLAEVKRWKRVAKDAKFTPLKVK
jgi:hypothetical protein